jgi:hypothetical protein
MVAIHNIVFGGTKRGLGSAGLWLGAALGIVMAGASLAEATGGSDPSLQAAMATSTVLPTSAAPGVADPAGAQAAAAEPQPRSDAEEQRRVFMLLLLNSVGPLRPYGGLSR